MTNTLNKLSACLRMNDYLECWGLKLKRPWFSYSSGWEWCLWHDILAVILSAVNINWTVVHPMILKDTSITMQKVGRIKIMSRIPKVKIKNHTFWKSYLKNSFFQVQKSELRFALYSFKKGLKGVKSVPHSSETRVQTPVSTCVFQNCL